MDTKLRFWVGIACQNLRLTHPGLSKRQLVAQVLRHYQHRGHAMRCLDISGRVAWKASPIFLEMLADAKQDAQDELEHCP
ncbi:MAG: hypothetical protein ACJ72H_15410 [Candidatus Sulfotelmatobacter sp.]